MAFLYVTLDNELRAVEWDGTSDVSVPQAGKVMQVSSTENTDNEEIWVLSSDPDTDVSIGGDLLLVCPVNYNNNPIFKEFVKPGGKKFGGTSIAAGKAGCYFVEEDYSIHHVDKDGNEKEVFPANTALKIENGHNGLVAVVSTEIDVDQGGNIIKWFYDADHPTLEDGGNNKAVGNMCAGQMNGISYIKPDGSFSNFTPGSTPPGGSYSVQGNPFRLINGALSDYYAITEEVHADGGNLIQCISEGNIQTVQTTKGVVYAISTGVPPGSFVKK